MNYFHVVITTLLLITFTFFSALPQKTTRLETKQAYTYTILLLPLDSRPACTKFIYDLGKIANIKIIMPPKELLDNYKETAQTTLLRDWLSENIKNVDASIISIDMLIHGSLLASRHPTGTPNDANITLQLLESIHDNHPKIPMYVFSILPRLWPADNNENEKYQKPLLEYSKLKDQVYTFENPIDLEKLNALENKIPNQVLQKYESLYQKNDQLNRNLILLTQKGVFKKLIIGQDDSQMFGIPNITKRQLTHYLFQQQISSDKVEITRGADEIALTLLGNMTSQLYHYQPKINVQYSDDEAASMIMPYMPNSVSTTVKEKIDSINGHIVSKPEDADFILFVHIGTEKNKFNRFAINKKIKLLLEKNYKVALVDLSENFSYDETIFPNLVNNAAPINHLISYAGWNTSSNSIGTALTQATIFTARLRTATEPNDILSLYKNNLTFLISRYLEDYYYLKDVIDTINDNLKTSNINPYDLDEHYSAANKLLNVEMYKKVNLIQHSQAFNSPLPIALHNKFIEIKPSNLTITTYFPWARTFEIYLDTQIRIEKLENN